ncbi:hypothetical protein [Amycolatopsis panacis]|uniref:hypothetical protein n=1 Tax=Amycolatopsis panacis TaxID=2340917 RepID=UPI0011C43110|nr:hypothetical protein [Amycolatopsis panacis]
MTQKEVAQPGTMAQQEAVAVAQPRVMLAELDRTATEQALTCPVDPGALSASGGMLAEPGK